MLNAVTENRLNNHRAEEDDGVGGGSGSSNVETCYDEIQQTNLKTNNTITSSRPKVTKTDPGPKINNNSHFTLKRQSEGITSALYEMKASPMSSKTKANNHHSSTSHHHFEKFPIPKDALELSSSSSVDVEAPISSSSSSVGHKLQPAGGRGRDKFIRGSDQSDEKPNIPSRSPKIGEGQQQGGGGERGRSPIATTAATTSPSNIGSSKNVDSSPPSAHSTTSYEKQRRILPGTMMNTQVVVDGGTTTRTTTRTPTSSFSLRTLIKQSNAMYSPSETSSRLNASDSELYVPKLQHQHTLDTSADANTLHGKHPNPVTNATAAATSSRYHHQFMRRRATNAGEGNEEEAMITTSLGGIGGGFLQQLPSLQPPPRRDISPQRNAESSNGDDDNSKKVHLKTDESIFNQQDGTTAWLMDSSSSLNWTSATEESQSRQNVFAEVLPTPPSLQPPSRGNISPQHNPMDEEVTKPSKKHKGRKRDDLSDQQQQKNPSPTTTLHATTNRKQKLKEAPPPPPPPLQPPSRRDISPQRYNGDKGSGVDHYDQSKTKKKHLHSEKDLGHDFSSLSMGPSQLLSETGRKHPPEYPPYPPHPPIPEGEEQQEGGHLPDVTPPSPHFPPPNHNNTSTGRKEFTSSLEQNVKEQQHRPVETANPDIATDDLFAQAVDSNDNTSIAATSTDGSSTTACGDRQSFASSQAVYGNNNNGKYNREYASLTGKDNEYSAFRHYQHHQEHISKQYSNVNKPMSTNTSSMSPSTNRNSSTQVAVSRGMVRDDNGMNKEASSTTKEYAINDQSAERLDIEPPSSSQSVSLPLHQEESDLQVARPTGTTRSAARRIKRDIIPPSLLLRETTMTEPNVIATTTSDEDNSIPSMPGISFSSSSGSNSGQQQKQPGADYNEDKVFQHLWEDTTEVDDQVKDMPSASTNKPLKRIGSSQIPPSLIHQDAASALAEPGYSFTNSWMGSDSMEAVSEEEEEGQKDADNSADYGDRLFQPLLDDRTEMNDEVNEIPSASSNPSSLVKRISPSQLPPSLILQDSASLIEPEIPVNSNATSNLAPRFAILPTVVSPATKSTHHEYRLDLQESTSMDLDDIIGVDDGDAQPPFYARQLTSSCSYGSRGQQSPAVGAAPMESLQESLYTPRQVMTGLIDDADADMTELPLYERQVTSSSYGSREVTALDASHEYSSNLIWELSNSEFYGPEAQEGTLATAAASPDFGMSTRKDEQGMQEHQDRESVQREKRKDQPRGERPSSAYPQRQGKGKNFRQVRKEQEERSKHPTESPRNTKHREKNANHDEVFSVLPRSPRDGYGEGIEHQKSPCQKDGPASDTMVSQSQGTPPRPNRNEHRHQEEAEQCNSADRGDCLSNDLSTPRSQGERCRQKEADQGNEGATVPGTPRNRPIPAASDTNHLSNDNDGLAFDMSIPPALGTPRTDRHKLRHQKEAEQGNFAGQGDGPANDLSNLPPQESPGMTRCERRRQKEADQGNEGATVPGTPRIIKPIAAASDTNHLSNDKDGLAFDMSIPPALGTPSRTDRHRRRRQKEAEQGNSADQGDGAANDLSNPRPQESPGMTRRERRRQKEVDQGNESATVPGTPRMSAYQGDGAAIDLSNPRPQESPGMTRRERRRQKEADQGNAGGYSPGTSHGRSDDTTATLAAASAMTLPKPIPLESQIGNQNGLRGGDFDAGDSQPRNFEPRRRSPEDSSEEYGDDYSEDEDEDLVPGAFNVTTQGIHYRQNKGLITDSQRFSSIGDGSKQSGGDISSVDGLSRSGTVHSNVQSRGGPLTGVAPPPHDEEAPHYSNTLQPITERERQKVCRKNPLFLIVLSLCLFVVVAIAVAVPLAFHGDDGSTTMSQLPTPPPPTTAPTVTVTMIPTLSERAIKFIDILKSVSAESALMDPNQPQSMAATWLADTDGAKLDPFSPVLDTRLVEERYVMALLYFTWNPKFTFSGFLSAAGYCGWNDSSEKGIFCKDSHISRIQLSQQGLKGSIPSEIFFLEDLETVYLDKNFLTGSIPTAIGNATTLRNIDFWLNKDLHGSIPETIESLSNLEKLLVGSTDLSGSIPASVFNTTGLKELSIRKTKMTGSIPTEIGLLTSLEVFEIQDTLSFGTRPQIPTEIGLLQELRVLELGQTELSGAIPTEMGRLYKLTHLRLDATDLDSTIPSEFGELRSLTSLRLDENSDLTGSIPAELMTLSLLTKLNLDGNTGLTDEEHNVVESLCATNQPLQDEELEFSVCWTDISCTCCRRNC